jgi:hypothetical protein
MATENNNEIGCMALGVFQGKKDRTDFENGYVNTF